MSPTVARLLKKYADRLDADAVDHDSDGWWFYPKVGWYLESMGSHLIHEYSLKDVTAALKTLSFGCTCRECVKG